MNAATFADDVSAQRPYLMRFARQRLRDPALVEDMVQETLLAALQGSSGYEGKAALRTWLTGILLRRIADGLRRRHRQGGAGAMDDDAADDGDGEVIEVDDPARHGSAEPVEWRDPQRMLEGRQFLQELAICLDDLPGPAARAFTLREIHGMSTAEVARALDMDAARCAMLLHRTRTRLRHRLARH
jgi:RNA polymerase sigma-70 factor (ECF subfamily)